METTICTTCQGPVKDEKCVGCGMPPATCTCKKDAAKEEGEKK